jgi:molecular chaperone DnaK
MQGEREMAGDNRTLGRFILDGIPPAPRGLPQIEVTFDIDANGILHVSAKDKATSKENKITIKANSGLSEGEIERMVRDAEANKAEDHKRFELAQSRNALDALVHSVRKSLAEYGDKVGADEKGKIEGAIKDAEEALKQPEVTKETLEAKAEALQSAAQKLGEAIYASQQAAGAQTGAGAEGGAQGGKAAGGGKADENVVDAEYTEVKDKK